MKIAQFIRERNGMTTVGAFDLQPSLEGVSLGTLCGGAADDVIIRNSLSQALEGVSADVAILTTVSDMTRITPQIEAIVALGIPVVSTCEELSFPWLTAPQLARRIDEAAKQHQVAVLGTGVNPGYLMDILPVFLTAVCQDVSMVRVNRFQNARFRRIPFQQKIGAGLSPEAFEKKRAAGSLRHVGLTESVHLIARRMGWSLDKVEDIIRPVIATNPIDTADLCIPAGHAAGVRQEGNGFVDGQLRIQLIFQASVGEPQSFDEVVIEGTPRLHSRIEGGVNGDVATCAITLNAIAQVLRAQPGLQTMADIPPVSFFS
jgi:4-hydroxy-tetrahydrodipicolinate reductase